MSVLELKMVEPHDEDGIFGFAPMLEPVKYIMTPPIFVRHKVMHPATQSSDKMGEA